MSLLGQPCQKGKTDIEQCGDGLICSDTGHKYQDLFWSCPKNEPENLFGARSYCCQNPCDGRHETRPVQGGGTGGIKLPPGGDKDKVLFYQNDPTKPLYDNCIQGVGKSGQPGKGQSADDLSSTGDILDRQNLNTNRFCLCVVDIGCGPKPPPPKLGLVFNIMWIVGDINSRNDSRDSGKFGSQAKCLGGSKRIDRPRITISTPWAKRDDNDEICVEGQCCKDGPGPGRGRFDCGEEIKAGWQPVADPKFTKRTAQQGFYQGGGEANWSCGYWFGGFYGGIKNGAATTQGVNTEGCEHMELYCADAIPCLSGGSFGNDPFPRAVQDAFDISSDEFGGYTAFKVSIETPPVGETREVFLHYHIGIKGAGGTKVGPRMWVHEMTKDKQDFATVASSTSGSAKPRQTGPYRWSDDTWDLCPNTSGGPNPDNPNLYSSFSPTGIDGKEATIGVLTVMPDATWTVALP